MLFIASSLRVTFWSRGKDIILAFNHDLILLLLLCRRLSVFDCENSLLAFSRSLRFSHWLFTRLFFCLGLLWFSEKLFAISLKHCLYSRRLFSETGLLNCWVFTWSACSEDEIRFCIKIDLERARLRILILILLLSLFFLWWTFVLLVSRCRLLLLSFVVSFLSRRREL